MTGAPVGTHAEIKLPPEVYEGALLAGRYRIGRMLGSGAMGAVFAAEHVELRELVAIKVLLLDSTPQASADALSRFTREAWAASKIKSEYVARVNDLGRLEDGTPYIVMEYLDGVDLEGLLHAHGTLAVEATVELMLQACEALAEAHVLGIFHRDLKPSNLFCVRRSDGLMALKLLDFGISKIARPATDSDPRLTLTAATLGTPLYMSPEQMRSGRIADERSDIWSLGVIMFELLTGRVPFNAQNLPDLAVLIATNDAPSVSGLRGEVPAELSQVIARCLDRESAQRFGNVAELARALTPFAPLRAAAHADRAERILQVVQPRRARITPVSSVGAATAVGSHSRLRAVSADTAVIARQRWRVIALSLAAAVLVGLLGVWALRRNAAPPPSAARPKETRANAALAPKPAAGKPPSASGTSVPPAAASTAADLQRSTGASATSQVAPHAGAADANSASGGVPHAGAADANSASGGVPHAGAAKGANSASAPAAQPRTGAIKAEANSMSAPRTGAPGAIRGEAHGTSAPGAAPKVEALNTKPNVDAALPAGKAPPPVPKRKPAAAEKAEKAAEKPADNASEKPAQKRKDSQLDSLGGRL